jgi:hypothetical protein
VEVERSAFAVAAHADLDALPPSRLPFFPFLRIQTHAAGDYGFDPLRLVSSAIRSRAAAAGGLERGGHQI